MFQFNLTEVSVWRTRFHFINILTNLCTFEHSLLMGSIYTLKPFRILNLKRVFLLGQKEISVQEHFQNFHETNNESNHCIQCRAFCELHNLSIFWIRKSLLIKPKLNFSETFIILSNKRLVRDSNPILEKSL
jgi:hypothetical protein